MAGVPAVFLLKTLIPVSRCSCSCRRVPSDGGSCVRSVVEFLPLVLFAAVFVALLAGYSVAATLAGVALLFALAGAAFGLFDLRDLGFLPGRLYGIVTNQTLIAVPLFVLMGVTLERTRIAETLLESLSSAHGRIRGGLGIAVTLVGNASWPPARASWAPRSSPWGCWRSRPCCATATTESLLPARSAQPARWDRSFRRSIALVLLGDVLSGAYQQAQLSQGTFSPKTVSVGDLFAGALLPGLVLRGALRRLLAVTALIAPSRAPGRPREQRDTGSWRVLLRGLAPPLILIVAVLGSILGGLATPTEAAGVGAMGALALAAAYRSLDVPSSRKSARRP